MGRADPIAGRVAEDAAARALERAGYGILARNLRTPFGELDLVAKKSGRIAFVEVKARRRDGSAGTGEDALTPAKLRRVGRAAEHVLRTRGLEGARREFLGIAVTLEDDGAPGDIRIVPVEEIR
ncbi:MAG: YraN family protein [Planctomycetes bacterium]|nr:YraN family protein [Planctomycetota bacterium]